MIAALSGPLGLLLQVQAHLRCQCRSSWAGLQSQLDVASLPWSACTCPPNFFPHLPSSCRCVQEQTKAWLHILLDIAVMICVMLSDPSLPHAPAPLPTLVVTAFLGVMDMVSLHESWVVHGRASAACLPLACRLPPSLVLTALLSWGVMGMGSLACACMGGSLSVAATSTGPLSQPGSGESRPLFRAATAVCPPWVAPADPAGHADAPLRHQVALFHVPGNRPLPAGAGPRVRTASRWKARKGVETPAVRPMCAPAPATPPPGCDCSSSS